MTNILLFTLGLFLGQIRKKTLMREGKPYLIRITLLKCPWFSVKIHKALISDPAIPHDHPWNYLSIILWGGYYEEAQAINPFKAFNSEPSTIWKQRWYGPGSFLYRKGDKFHKLIIPIGRPSISLIFVGKKWRDWGFYDFYKGWVSHKQTKIY